MRDNTALSPEFLDSIQQHGVLVPITAVRGQDKRSPSANGKRRTLAAREAGLTSIPAYVLPANAADEGTAAVERIVRQIVTNDHQVDTSGERADGIHFTGDVVGWFRQVEQTGRANDRPVEFAAAHSDFHSPDVVADGLADRPREDRFNQPKRGGGSLHRVGYAAVELTTTSRGTPALRIAATMLQVPTEYVSTGSRVNETPQDRHNGVGVSHNRSDRRRVAHVGFDHGHVSASERKDARAPGYGG